MFNSLLEVSEFFRQLLSLLPFSVYAHFLLIGFLWLGTALFSTLQDG